MLISSGSHKPPMNPWFWFGLPMLLILLLLLLSPTAAGGCVADRHPSYRWQVFEGSVPPRNKSFDRGFVADPGPLGAWEPFPSGNWNSHIGIIWKRRLVSKKVLEAQEAKSIGDESPEG